MPKKEEMLRRSSSIIGVQYPLANTLTEGILRYKLNDKMQENIHRRRKEAEEAENKRIIEKIEGDNKNKLRKDRFIYGPTC